MVAALIRKALIANELGQETFSVWGDGAATRDFIFVRDAANAIASIATATSQHGGTTYNLGSGVKPRFARWLMLSRPQLATG